LVGKLYIGNKLSRATKSDGKTWIGSSIRNSETNPLRFAIPETHWNKFLPNMVDPGKQAEKNKNINTSYRQQDCEDREKAVAMNLFIQFHLHNNISSQHQVRTYT
jgi:hypothetical protein